MKGLDLVNRVAVDVKNAGGRLYFVGGYVRDKLLGIESKDIDVECIGLTPEKYISILGKYGNVDKIGKSFGVYMIKGYDIDFSMGRTENKIGKSHKDFEVYVDPNITVKEACMRRDFTINSLNEDILTGDIVGDIRGVEDLRKGIIRVTNKKTFIEDELRVLRACQFSSRFNFKIDSEVFLLSKKFNYNLPKERIEEELNKLLLRSEKPSTGLRNMERFGLFDKLLPNLKFDKNLYTTVDRMSKITKYYNNKNRLSMMYVALGINGKLSDITVNKNIINFKDSLEPFPRPSKYNYRRAYFNGTLLYELQLKYSLGKIDFNSVINQLNYSKNIDNMYNKRLVTGDDLIKLGLVPSKNFTNYMNTTLELQFNGFNREQIINKIKNIYLP